MRQDERAPFVTALRDARYRAYPAGEFVGQESFVTANEIRQVADRAGIGRSTSVLDVCCGIAGPGRMIVAERGCSYTGVDYSASALQLARDFAGDLPCEFIRGHVPPLPDGHFDVVLLLEAMLAFPDKRTLLGAVSRTLAPGGRFALTIEVGRPLSASEQSRMPDADTVQLVEFADFRALLRDVGFAVVWQRQRTVAHQRMATALLESFQRDRVQIAGEIGRRALADLITAHQLWSDWLRSGRVRKYAIVAVSQ